MPNLTRRFRRRFATTTEEGHPQPKYSVGDFVYVTKGRYQGKLGRVEDVLWDAARSEWVYTAFATDRNEAINPYESEVRAYKMPKSAMVKSSAGVFPPPAWLSAEEKSDWSGTFERLLASDTPVSPRVFADPLLQLAIFAHRNQLDA